MNINSIQALKLPSSTKIFLNFFRKYEEQQILKAKEEIKKYKEKYNTGFYEKTFIQVNKNIVSLLFHAIKKMPEYEVEPSFDINQHIEVNVLYYRFDNDLENIITIFLNRYKLKFNSQNNIIIGSKIFQNKKVFNYVMRSIFLKYLNGG